MAALNGMKYEDLIKFAELLQRQNEDKDKVISTLQSAQLGQVYFKVSKKGAVSVYGMGRFPVTLFREAWLKLAGDASQIRKDLILFVDARTKDGTICVGKNPPVSPIKAEGNALGAVYDPSKDEDDPKPTPKANGNDDKPIGEGVMGG